MSRFSARWGICVMMFACAGAGQAQDAAGYPTKTIRLVISLAPGGGVDTSGRLLGQRFTDAWGQQVVAENRAGAGGTIATEQVARAAPDGYTLLMQSMSHAITPALYKLSYDTIKDFAPISLFVQSPSVLAVHPSLPVKSVSELIVFTKARPNEILFSSSGSGSGQHLAMELLNRMAGLQLVHIPYKGTASSILDLVAGRVSVTSASAISTMPHVRSGRLRALAVASAKRSPSVPELVTIAEAGVPGFAVDQWYALFAADGARSGRHAARRIRRLREDGDRQVGQPGSRGGNQGELRLPGGAAMCAPARTPARLCPTLMASVPDFGCRHRRIQ